MVNGKSVFGIFDNDSFGVFVAIIWHNTSGFNITNNLIGKILYRFIALGFR